MNNKEIRFIDRTFLLQLIISFVCFSLSVLNVKAGNNDCNSQIPDCDLESDVGSIRYECSDLQYDYYQVSIYGTYDNVAVFTYTGGAAILDTVTEGKFRLRFELNSNWAQLWYGEQLVSMSDAQSNECVSQAPQEPKEPLVECVGFVIEGLTTFEIDNMSYTTPDGFVSFLVPETDLWTWIMTSDGRYVMTFVQDQVGNCRVTDIDSNWSENEPDL